MRTAGTMNPTSLSFYLWVYHGLTQREVATGYGLTCNDVCRFERGHDAISFSKLQVLARFYQITADALFHNDFRALAARRGRRGSVQALRQRIRARQLL